MQKFTEPALPCNGTISFVPSQERSPLRATMVKDESSSTLVLVDSQNGRKGPLAMSRVVRLYSSISETVFLGLCYQ